MLQYRRITWKFTNGLKKGEKKEQKKRACNNENKPKKPYKISRKGRENRYKKQEQDGLFGNLIFTWPNLRTRGLALINQTEQALILFLFSLSLSKQRENFFMVFYSSYSSLALLVINNSTCVSTWNLYSFLQGKYLVFFNITLPLFLFFVFHMSVFFLCCLCFVLLLLFLRRRKKLDNRC